MKHWKNKFLALLFTIVMMLSMTACESYDEWEARTESERTQTGQQESLQTPSGQKGPSLADYVNAGLEEAKQNGQYTESDYSDIRADGSSAGPGQNTDNNSDSAGQTTDNTGQTPDNSIDNTNDWAELNDYLVNLEYEGEPYICVNDNIPYFTEEDIALTEAFEFYSELDELGRTQYAFASIDESIMPADDEERGDISSVKPTGWIQAKYEGIGNGNWLYNRCHLIAWSLASENANECNLMTGTRYFNVEGMLPFEIQALSYLGENPENHLLYRATPIYKDDELLARGLLLESYSIEDNGELSFCVYLFNVQPGIEIDYKTGESRIGE